MKKISLLLATTLAGTVAQAQLIDDFSGGSLGAYTLTRILDNNVAVANVSFSDTGGVLSAAYGGTGNAAEQVVFLRSDYSLSVGSRLLVDVAFPTQASEMDFGLAVSATATPASVASPSPTDTRGTFNWAGVYVRPSQNAVRSTSSIGGTVVTGTGILSVDETLVSRLFIERTSLTDFVLGYYNTSDVQVISRTVTFTATDVGTAIGFYGDLRAVGGTLSSLDNLRIEVIPEPTSAALLGLGSLALLFRARRK